MHLCETKILIFTMCSTCFETRVHLQEEGCTANTPACKQIIPYLYIPSSWRWTLWFKTCRRHREN